MTLAFALFTCTTVLVVVPTTLAEDTSPSPVISLEQRRELFVDDFLIESLQNARLELQHPQPQELVFATDERWEGSACGYFRVLRDGDLYRMWYMTYHWPFEPGESAPTHPFFVGYAESDDGVNWRKPKLGLYEFEGSKENNICCIDVIDNFTPFIDTNPQCPPTARYKAVGVGKLRRYTLRIDGFVAATAPLSGGEILTKPITFSGNSLSLNFATSAAGQIRVEIHDAATGKALPGYSMEDCDELFGDTLDRRVTWHEMTDLSAIRGQVVRLRFVLRDADLYSFQFCE